MENYFICPRCGYENNTGKFKQHCPICGMDCNIYSIDLIALTIIALFFLSWVLSMFGLISDSIFWGLFWVEVPTCVIMFIRSLDRNGYMTDGYITPNSPNDIINDTTKHIKYKKYKYFFFSLLVHNNHASTITGPPRSDNAPAVSNPFLGDKSFSVMSSMSSILS